MPAGPSLSIRYWTCEKLLSGGSSILALDFLAWLAWLHEMLTFRYTLCARRIGVLVTLRPDDALLPSYSCYNGISMFPGGVGEIQ